MIVKRWVFLQELLHDLIIRANGLRALACNDGFNQLIGLSIVDFYLVLNERPLIFHHELVL